MGSANLLFGWVFLASFFNLQDGCWFLFNNPDSPLHLYWPPFLSLVPLPIPKKLYHSSSDLIYLLRVPRSHMKLIGWPLNSLFRLGWKAGTEKRGNFSFPPFNPSVLRISFLQCVLGMLFFFLPFHMPLIQVLCFHLFVGTMFFRNVLMHHLLYLYSGF
jgi:hypothetical protein